MMPATRILHAIVSAPPPRPPRPPRSAGARAWFALFVASAAIALGAVPAVAGIDVSLVAASTTVAPNSDFDVEIRVTASGSPFNAIDAVVSYDPAAVTRVSLSPLSLQEGSLLTASCGNRFHRFRPGSDRDTMTLVLLCNGVSVTGPGQVYRLRFHASATPQATTIRFETSPRFYNAGVSVLPVTSNNLNIGIGVTLDVPGGPREGDIGVSVRPNPARGPAHITVRSPRAGAGHVVVCDAAGRVLRRLESGWIRPGTSEFVWDGRDAAGTLQPAGCYFVRVRAGELRSRATLVRVR